jgi:hypothetical protein
VIVSASSFNKALPDSIAAWFVIKGQTDPKIDVVQAHAAFLREYQLTARAVPLLELDPKDWDQPFREIGRINTRSS